MMVLETHIVPLLSEEIRLQDYGTSIFSAITTKSALKKTIKQGGIRIDGEIATTGHWIKEGQTIELLDLEKPLQKIFKLPLTVIFEDDHLAIIKKPAGYPTSGNYFRTIQNALPFNLKISKGADAMKIPRPVHRLDNPTSGLLIIAKTRSAQKHLHQQFEEQHISKTYVALVVGTPKLEGEITLPINDRAANTYFETLKTVNSLRNETLSSLKLYPRTGRTHQLRIHLSAIGHPIVGDALYGKEGHTLKHKGLFLSAVGLALKHPHTDQRLRFELPPPNKFTLLMEKEERRYKKFNP
ncbi:pseudouridine synthase [Sungkyunkwania multivorans]|uniref:Pseudouridine synthase n=1 Tax=Sungkyunkwania multivorans TaxID=1173618 RepID=A0ABW3CWF8_9FLAO